MQYFLELQQVQKEICADCDLVIEAAIENMEIKKQTFKELDAICKADTILQQILHLYL